MTIQADTRFVNDYRNFAVAALGETLALAAFGPLPRLNESALAAHVHVSQADFEYCARRWPKGGCVTADSLVNESAVTAVMGASLGARIIPY